MDDSAMDQVVDGEYGSAKEKSVAGQNASRQLSQPVKGKLVVAQVLAFLSGVLAIARMWLWWSLAENLCKTRWTRRG